MDIIFLSTHETFVKTDHMLGHKTKVNPFKRIEIIPDVIFDQ